MPTSLLTKWSGVGDAGHIGTGGPVVLRLAVVLLYTAGLRRGELLRLTLADVDPTAGVLRIRESKFHKSRFVPLSPDACRELRTYLRQAATPSYDAAGTCRMGDGPMTVVDPALKVRGVEGVWVADASVMPSLVAGGANATAIMIGEKGADLVKAALGA